MKPIFDNAEKTGNTFHSRIIFADSDRNFGHDLYVVRENLARQVADAILKDERFFKTESLAFMGATSVNLDCLVFTPKEYEDLMLAQFQLGASSNRNYHHFSLDK